MRFPQLNIFFPYVFCEYEFSCANEFIAADPTPSANYKKEERKGLPTGSPVCI